MIEFGNPSQSLFDRQSQSDRVWDEPDLYRKFLTQTRKSRDLV